MGTSAVTPVTGIPQQRCSTPEMNTHAAALARTTIFHGIPEADLSQLAALAQQRHVAAGQVVFMAGDPARGLYLIVR